MKNIFVILFAVLNVTAALAQDPQFSQYYQAPLYLNPGFAGVTPGHRLAVNHRLQWPSLPQAFSTYAASYDAYLENIRSGVGVLFTTDKMGSVNWNSTTMSVFYSYKIQLTEELVFSPGLSFGYGTNGLDRSKLRMGDALQYGGNTFDPKIDDIRSQRYADFGSGFVLYAERVWLGASFMHMNRPDLSLIDEGDRLGMKTSIHGGMRIDIDGGLRQRSNTYLTPSFIYRMQGSRFSQLDLGVNFHVDPVSVGASYRGKPFSKGIDGVADQDALILFMGLYLQNLTVGYSYDFTISGLTSSGGAHELSLMYALKRKNNKPRRQRLIPCPAFYGR